MRRSCFVRSIGNDLILGAVGPLQFEVAAYRLRDEYSVEAVFESVGVVAARWVRCDDEAHLDEFIKKLPANVARDHTGQLVYLGAQHREPVSDARALAEDPVLHDPRVERRGRLSGQARATRNDRDLGRERRQRCAVGVGLVARPEIQLDDAANPRGSVR